jgi:hypothetical protein
VKLIETGEVKIMVIDDGSNSNFPPAVMKIKLNMIGTEKIESSINEAAKNGRIISKREVALEQRCARIFYIYAQLMERGRISKPEILRKTGISDRTLKRDIRLIRDVCTDKKIDFDPSMDGWYFMRDLKPKEK